MDCKKICMIGEGLALKGPEAKGRALYNVLYFEFQKLVTLRQVEGPYFPLVLVSGQSQPYS